jgi:hypothetical protein
MQTRRHCRSLRPVRRAPQSDRRFLPRTAVREFEFRCAATPQRYMTVMETWNVVTWIQQRALL